MIIFDTETTGLPLPGISALDKQPRIIDFAAVKIAPVKKRGAKSAVWQEVDRIEFLVNPGHPLPPEITKITGYTDADLEGVAPFVEYLDDVTNFFLGERSIVAHNAPFDLTLLRFELERLDRVTSFPWPPVQICTAALSVEKYARRLKLVELYEQELGRKLDQKHTAMADVEALLEVVMAMKVYELSGEG